MNWRAEHVCQVIIDLLRPTSLIDVGCATGDIVAKFIEMGIDAWGLEGSANVLPFLEIPSDRFFLRDLRLPVDIGRYDLALCLEVAEHIEPEYTDQFVKNLVGLSDKIVVSIAPPGQGGHYHVNCQPQEYWDEKFGVFGYEHLPWMTQLLKKGLRPWGHKAGIKAYYWNIAYYGKLA